MTAQKPYELALALMDEIDTDGTINATKTAFYSGKAPRLIDLLQLELAHIEGVRVTNRIDALTDTLEISDDTAMRILPYGLAWKFALADNLEDMYLDYGIMYQKLQRGMRFDEQDVYDEYDVMDGMN